jgi:phosphoribosylaminoimidazole carboxylase (NCAIR synthetase)
MVVAAFVAPYLLEATTQFVTAAARLPDVRLGIVTNQAADELPPAVRQHAHAHWRVADALDPRQIAEAVTGLGSQLGRVDRLVGALEQLQVPLAEVREAMGIEGMDVPTALNVRDKSRMKTVLDDARVPCARHRLVRSPGEAVSFAEAVGFPLVAKPPAGAGAQSTYRLDDPATLHAWLQAVPPRPGAPALLEEFLVGEEHSFESVTLGGQTVWSSISDYVPPPLEVLRNPWMQWTVLLPRDVTGPEYAEIHRLGPVALRALGVRDALTHMEWFRRPDGSIAVSEVAARPPGAQMSSMLGHAHDVDFHRAWAELVVLGRFDPPERRYAAGTAYLRGQGRGWVRAVHGLDEIQRQLGHLVVEARLPQPGQPAAGDYLGEGFIMVRDPDTEVVRDALRRVVSGVRVELVEAR